MSDNPALWHKIVFNLSLLRIFCSGILGMDGGDVYFREDMFWRYLPWSLDHLVNNKLHKYLCMPFLGFDGNNGKQYLQNM